MTKKEKNIGDILIENSIITKEVMGEALKYQTEFGGNLTQYLITHNYLKEEDLVKCISSQFGYPYLPLMAYDIPHHIIKLLPAEIAEKHWLIPVDKIENLLTVVMANPLDKDAIEEVERATKCKVQPFVGMRSDIAKAIERSYNIYVGTAGALKSEKEAPLFIGTKRSLGLENRRSIRIKSNISIHFTEPGAAGEAKDMQTKDVSRYGFLFESPNILPLGSYLMLKVDLPKEVSTGPVTVVGQVVRVVPLENKKFDIGIKIVTMPKGASDKIVKHALDVSKRASGKK